MELGEQWEDVRGRRSLRRRTLCFQFPSSPCRVAAIVIITGCCCCACDHRRLWVRHRRGWSRAEEGEETSVTAEPNAGERRSPRERSLLPSLLPPENTSAATEICRRRRCRSSGRRCRSRWLPELPPNRSSDRRCFIFLVRVVF
ncbi:uncharacterized protein LOC107635034 [Arachis ipaensis]|uniref:uncharacterized protein LOC107635034 n=1 Tax=Arachis ipaensis TaxID=130454 RepID=UPI0007AFA057|nr:uncharacterized protein LOC107635034 [Arachis ipaensis]XP_025649395.1 uncharacterized protein LOC112744108 [Arachis hypogaea]XP_025649396.1 uncharacterized protein LOC112744108 [Arachis hypogaea]